MSSVNYLLKAYLLIFWANHANHVLVIMNFERFIFEFRSIYNLFSLYIQWLFYILVYINLLYIFAFQCSLLFIYHQGSLYYWHHRMTFKSLKLYVGQTIHKTTKIFFSISRNQKSLNFILYCIFSYNEFSTWVSKGARW